VLKPKEQGDWGERQAVIWLLEQGASVFVPVAFSSPDFDLVADFGEEALRVQVKTSRVHRGGRWELAVCTRGGNQSWNGVVKRLDASRYDYLFVALADGRRWWIPSRVVGGGTSILLGGPKYHAYEVQSGAPMPTDARPASTIHASRGDSGAVKRAWL
jgi:PD-(D/E)XK endonuclease